MRDIGKRTAVDNDRRMLQRLHQIRLDRIFQDRRHGALCMQVSGCDRLFLGRLSVCISDDQTGKSLLEIPQVFCQTERSHDFG